MTRETINAKGAPAAVGPYGHAVKAGDTVYTSGQLGLIPETGLLPEGVEAQARQAMENLKAVLEAAGLTMADVVKTRVFYRGHTGPLLRPGRRSSKGRSV